MMTDKKSDVKTLSETERYVVWTSLDEENDESIYHVELGNITVHFFEDEWTEFVSLMLESVR